MKKKLMAVLIAIMAVSVTACAQTVSSTDNSEEIAELREEIEALKEENAELKAKLEATETSSSKQTDEEDSELENFIVETSGVCGADLTWEYGNGVLWIHGTGDMTEYDYDNVPWNDLKGKIGHVYVDEGVETIGDHAFGDMEIASKIVLPASVKRLGYFSFVGAADYPAFDTAVEITEEEKNDTIKKTAREDLERSLPSVQRITWGSNSYSSTDELFDVLEIE